MSLLGEKGNEITLANKDQDEDKKSTMAGENHPLKDPPRIYLFRMSTENQTFCSKENEKNLSGGLTSFKDTENDETLPPDKHIEATKNSNTFKFSNFSRRSKYLFLFCLFAEFIGGCTFSIIAPFFPAVAAEKGMSITLTSFVFSEFELISLITSPFFGNYLSFLGPKLVLVSGTFIAGVCTLLFAALIECPSGATFIALSILCRGIGAVGLSAVFNSTLAVVSNEFPKYFATCVAIISIANGCGLMLGPVIGGGLYDLGGFKLPFIVIGVLTIISGILMVTVMPAPGGAPVEKRGSRISLLRNPMVVIPMFSIVIGTMGMPFLDPTLANHLKPFDLSFSIIGLFFLIGPLVYIAFTPLWAFLTDKVMIHSHCLVFGHVVYGLGFLLIGPCSFFSFIPFELWTVITGLVLIGITFGCFLIPTMKCMVIGATELGFEENLDTCAILSGIFNTTYSTGGFLGPMLAGVLVEKLGYSIAYTVVGMMSIGMGIVTFLFFMTRYLSCVKK